MIPAFTQRWNSGTDVMVPVTEPIDPSRYGVEVFPDDTTPRAFVRRHHYSGSYPAARCRVGLYRRRVGAPGSDLVGVAVFSVGVQPAAIRKHLGLPAAQGVELGRFVLLDDVPANGETWFLARAFAAMRAELPEVRGVLSYSDPVPRDAASGRRVMPGHVGIIYQAHNGRYVGRGKADTLILDADARVVNRRGLTKIRKGESGATAAYDRLVAAGAPRMRPGESATAWVARALAEGPFRRMRHPGNHAYVWAFDRPARRGLAAASGPFPKAPEEPRYVPVP